LNGLHGSSDCSGLPAPPDLRISWSGGQSGTISDINFAAASTTAAKTIICALVFTWTPDGAESDFSSFQFEGIPSGYAIQPVSCSAITSLSTLSVPLAYQPDSGLMHLNITDIYKLVTMDLKTRQWLDTMEPIKCDITLTLCNARGKS